LVLVPSTIPDQQAPVSKYRTDPRRTLIENFFRERGCPASEWAEDFLVAADLNGLDWRLLPGIAFTESTGGKAYYNNNILGWNSARSRFPSVRTGIYFVAGQLANARGYRNKDLEKVLQTYNPSPGYTTYVKRVMAQLDQQSSSETAYSD